MFPLVFMFQFIKDCLLVYIDNFCADYSLSLFCPFFLNEKSNSVENNYMCAESKIAKLLMCGQGTERKNTVTEFQC